MRRFRNDVGLQTCGNNTAGVRNDVGLQTCGNNTAGVRNDVGPQTCGNNTAGVRNNIGPQTCGNPPRRTGVIRQSETTSGPRRAVTTPQVSETTSGSRRAVTTPQVSETTSGSRRAVTTPQVSENKMGFTIVELLTVMSIIVILIGLLVPALNMAKRYATDVKQRAQFHGIDVALQLFSSEFEGYPDSDALDEAAQQYPGATRLCEAMVGQDLLGFHPDSRFRADCTTDGTNGIYDNPQGFLGSPTLDNLQARRGPYLQLENANAYKLKDIYEETSAGAIGALNSELFVLCDEYARVKNKRTGKKIGMPILYYKANLAGTRNPTEENGYEADPGSSGPQNIYDFKDNDDLVDIGIPWMAGQEHPMDADQPDNIHNDGLGVRETFYFRIHNERITITDGRPYRSDSYILISAGFDGQYGTRDDIFNFEP